MGIELISRACLTYVFSKGMHIEFRFTADYSVAPVSFSNHLDIFIDVRREDGSSQNSYEAEEKSQSEIRWAMSAFLYEVLIFSEHRGWFTKRIYKPKNQEKPNATVTFNFTVLKYPSNLQTFNFQQSINLFPFFFYSSRIR